MLSIEETKKILKNENMSDAEAEEIRDCCQGLAEVIFDKWMEDRKNKKKP